jgi:hypothetical protein
MEKRRVLFKSLGTLDALGSTRMGNGRLTRPCANFWAETPTAGKTWVEFRTHIGLSAGFMNRYRNEK